MSYRIKGSQGLAQYMEKKKSSPRLILTVNFQNTEDKQKILQAY